MGVDPEAEKHAGVVESRLALAHQALVSYERRKEETTVAESEGEEEEGAYKENQQQQQPQQPKESKQVPGSDEQQHLQHGRDWISIETEPRRRLGGGRTRDRGIPFACARID